MAAIGKDRGLFCLSTSKHFFFEKSPRRAALTTGDCTTADKF
jgi:hypothetical protein